MVQVTGSDFSQEIATLTTHIERLRQDIEVLRDSVQSSAEVEVYNSRGQPLRSALRKSSRYDSSDVSSSDQNGELPSSSHSRHRRNLSCGSGVTSASSGTEYWSAVSSDEEEFRTPPDIESLSSPVSPGLGYEESELVELFAKLDDLMEGSQEQQQLALKLITDR